MTMDVTSETPDALEDGVPLIRRSGRKAVEDVDLDEYYFEHGIDLDVGDAEDLSQSDAEVEALPRFGRAFDPVKATTFEVMMERARQFKSLPKEEVVRLVLDAKSESNSSAASASKLLDHHMMWLVYLLRRHEMVGGGIMDDPSSNRAELFQEACMMFIHAIEKFRPEMVQQDPSRAEREYHKAFHKVFLACAQGWVRKRVSEVQSRELYGLEQPNAREQMRLRRLRADLAVQWGYEPSPEEMSKYLWEEAKRRLKEEIGTEPGETLLRSRAREFGWVNVGKIRSLLQFNHHSVRLDTPFDDPEGRPLADVLPDENAVDADRDLDRERIRPLLARLVRDAPVFVSPARAEIAFEAAMGLDGLVERSPEEAARLIGVASAETGKRYVQTMSRALMGEMGIKQRIRVASASAGGSKQTVERSVTLYPPLRARVRRAFGRD